MPMDKGSLFHILLALSFFLGATVQYSEGSNALGVLLFTIALLSLSRAGLAEGRFQRLGRGRARALFMLGALIVLADLLYNLHGLGRSGLNTLDTMILLLGISLAATAAQGDIGRLGVFGAFMSITFIALYLLFYILLNHQLYRFDHYFVMLPSAFLIKRVGVPIEVTGTETLRITGIADLLVKIGGPCSGLYSMFLLIGIVVGYTASEGGRAEMGHALAMTGVAAFVAYLGNLLRVSAIYYVGYRYGAETMMAVHVHLGWVIFAVTSLGILLVLERMQGRIGG